MANSNVGRFVWHEHLTKNPKAAIAFYSDVVGWKAEPFGQEYMMWVGSQGPLGGTMKMADESAKNGALPHWMGHVQVDDVDATVDRAKKLAAKVVRDPTDIPTVGRFAVITDPRGAEISLFKPNRDMAPHDMTKEGEFCWNELMTSDPAGAFKFYSELFGWKKMAELDMGERVGTYLIFGLGETQLGGIMKQPAGMPMPPMWVYYTETKDLENAIGRATGKGGTVMNGPVEVPGGRIAQLMDPEGAMFALHQAA
jgi:predicted enzyme related to lactoylglutathione lyase